MTLLWKSRLRLAGGQHFDRKSQRDTPEGPQYYPDEQITEVFERDIAAEMIRAAAIANLEDELPYSIAVDVDEYKIRDNDMLYIHGTIYIEREAQKPIVIGRKAR